MNKKQFFQENGYFIGRGILDQVAVDRVSDAADNLLSIAERNPADMFCNYYLPHRVDQGALFDVYQRDPTFRATAENPHMIGFLREIFGEEFYLFENSMIYKPKGAENAVPWHQDFMYMTGDPDKAIVWAALDDINEENGCLYAIPGSHTKGALPWFDVKGETHHMRTKLEHVDETKAVPLLMAPGDVLVFNQFLLHSSRKVAGDRKRRAFRFAIKRLENSYTPRGAPIILSRNREGSGLLEPHIDNRRGGITGKLGRALIRLGERIAIRNPKNAD